MTERNWRHAKNAYGCNFVYRDEGAGLVCGGNNHDTLTEDDAKLIVRAVNSFDDMKAVLEQMVKSNSRILPNSTFLAAEKALAKVNSDE